MPKPELVRLLAQLRKRLLAVDAELAGDIINAYGPIWTELSGRVETLLAQVKADGLSAARAQKLARFQELSRQVKGRVEAFAVKADPRIALAQRAAINQALMAAEAVTDASLPPGITLNLLGRVDLGWNRLPSEAFEVFVGMAGDGKPLMNLLAPLGSEVQTGVKKAILQGIALGKSPRETVRMVRNETGMGLTRSLTISRTETLRAYREATRLQYTANKNIIKGYRRVSARDSDVCLACIALDGELYETNQLLQTHVNCRCALRPETVSYRDLGLDVDEAPPIGGSAQDWFKGEPESVQRKMMGDAKFEAWQAGKFELGDMVKIERSKVWGDSAVEKTLKELIR